MRPSAASLVLFVAPFLGSCGSSDDGGAVGRNLLLITLDTTRADSFSCLGGEPGTTPNLDRLAARSTLFTGAVSQTNTTCPSHISIVTGLAMIEHGVMSNFVPIPEGLDTLPDAMKRAGYATAGFAAAGHMGPQLGWRGFDVLPSPPETGHLDAAEVTDRAVDWLSSREQEPFLLWVHYFDPHFEYNPPEEIARSFYPGDPTSGDGPPIASHEFFSRSKGMDSKIAAAWLQETRDPEFPRAMYRAEIHYVDREIGRLLAALDADGLGGDTLIVVIADHGESLDEHDLLYNHKGLYEQQLRIPFIFHVPGLPPTRSDALVSTLDVVPTLTELLDLGLRHTFRGASLLPILRGEAERLPRRPTFVHQSGRNRALAVRDGDWKLLWTVAENHPILPAEPQLFDLAADPAELENLAADHPEVLRDLRRRIAPLIDLGVVEGGAVELSRRAIEELRKLGYGGE